MSDDERPEGELPDESVEDTAIDGAADDRGPDARRPDASDAADATEPSPDRDSAEEYADPDASDDSDSDQDAGPDEDTDPDQDTDPDHDVDPADAEDPSADDADDIASTPELTDAEAKAIAEDEARRSADPKTVWRWLGRIATGVATLAAAGGLVALALTPPPGIASVEPASVEAQPGGFSQTLACAPGFVRIGTVDVSDASAIATIGAPAVQIAGDAEAQDGLPLIDDLAGGTAPLVVAPPDAAHAAAAAVQTVTDDSVGVGLAASACAEPSRSQWLVGGATSTGRQAILIVSNPNVVSASISITVYGENGPVRGPGSTGIDVPAGQSLVIDLASLAPGLTSIITHVESTGTPIVAHVESITTRVLDAGGLDIVDPVRGPGTELVFPGLRGGTVPALAAVAGYEDLVPTLRIMTLEDATVEMSFAADNGEAVTSETHVTGGVVTDVRLDNIPEGTYHLTIRSDVPIVASLHQVSAGAGDANDYDWIAAASTVEGLVNVPVPEGPGAEIHLANPGDVPVEALVGESTVLVPAHSGTSLAVVQGATTVDADGPLAIAVSYLGDGLIAGFSVQPKSLAAEPIEVHF